jgi:hypothetical protein
MKSLAVIDVVPLGQIGGNSRESGTAQEEFERVHLRLAAAHPLLEEPADKGRHAGAGFGGLDAQPIGDILAQSDRDVSHDTNIV